MEEIKIRLNAINAGTSGSMPLYPQIVKEFCFLQIRLICELVALGCLVAHGDLTISSRLKKEWSAEKIMAELEGLHSDFFPQPMQQGRNTDGTHLLTALHNQMSKSEFIKLYIDCGDVLHRGSLKKLLSQKTPVQVHYPEITGKAQKLNDLLNVHVLASKYEQKFFLCVLRNMNDNMRTQVAICERPSSL